MKETEKTMLELMLRPAFCAAAGRITACNAAAQALLLEEGQALEPLLLTGREDLDSLKEGCLYLQLALPGGSWGAAVTPAADGLLFVLEEDDSALQALSLAAKELREPLSALLSLSGSLLPGALPQNDKAADILARMSKELYSLQRIVGNMSDAQQAASYQEMRNVSQVFDDIFQKAQHLLSLSGIQLRYNSLTEDLYSLLDMDQIERAVLNLLSNAAKFGCGSIQASLCRQGSFLRLSIRDDGPGMEPQILGSLFSRFLRQPGIEDSRYGLGLGMVLVRSAANAHGGTVLVDQPETGGLRVTMTLKLRQCSPCKLHSPRLDITGGRDQALIELSEILPAQVYKKEL